MRSGKNFPSRDERGVVIIWVTFFLLFTLAITALGIDILDNQDLEAVGETAARLNRWEFMISIAPVPVTGGTGFPVNALATF